MPPDRLKASLRAVIEALVGRRLDYLALYEATVLSQNGDDSLSVRADDARIGDLPRVPLRVGVPGITVVTAPGARVLIGFEGGDPRAPYASFWDAGGLKELRFAGTAGVARVNDPVIFTLPTPTVPISGICPVGPFTGTLMIPPLPIRGKITSGSSKVKAG